MTATPFFSHRSVRPGSRGRSANDAVLDAAAEPFYARGVHEVGMDELIATTGPGKRFTVYRLFPTKDALIGAHRRSAQDILGAIDADIARHHEDPAAAIRAVFAAVQRTCPSRLPRLCLQQRQHRVLQPRPSRAGQRSRLSRRPAPGA